MGSGYWGWDDEDDAEEYGSEHSADPDVNDGESMFGDSEFDPFETGCYAQPDEEVDEDDAFEDYCNSRMNSGEEVDEDDAFEDYCNSRMGRGEG
jgi:hypothetical protein